MDETDRMCALIHMKLSRKKREALRDIAYANKDSKAVVTIDLLIGKIFIVTMRYWSAIMKQTA